MKRRIAMCASKHLRPDPAHRHGWALLYSRQRDSLSGRASKDKDFIVIEGATHGVSPCTECETTPGQYSNSVKNFFDYVQQWINARF